jgi:hypothetical protein
MTQSLPRCVDQRTPAEPGSKSVTSRNLSLSPKDVESP